MLWFYVHLIMCKKMFAKEAKPGAGIKIEIKADFFFDFKLYWPTKEAPCGAWRHIGFCHPFRPQPTSVMSSCQAVTYSLTSRVLISVFWSEGIKYLSWLTEVSGFEISSLSFRIFFKSWPSYQLHMSVRLTISYCMDLCEVTIWKGFSIILRLCCTCIWRIRRTNLPLFETTYVSLRWTTACFQRWTLCYSNCNQNIISYITIKRYIFFSVVMVGF